MPTDAAIQPQLPLTSAWLKQDCVAEQGRTGNGGMVVLVLGLHVVYMLVHHACVEDGLVSFCCQTVTGVQSGWVDATRAGRCASMVLAAAGLCPSAKLGL